MLGCALAACLVAVASDAHSRLDEMVNTLAQQSVAIHDRYHVNPYAFVNRIQHIQERLSDAPELKIPELSSDLERQVQIELDLDQAMLGTSTADLTRTHGVVETIVPTSGDGDAVGYFIPSAPAPNGKYSLVVMLHGAGETEVDVLSRGIFQQLAEQHHAILLAPWANADDLWGPRSEAEVLAEMDHLRRLFPIDPRRVYMAGISMGGAGAFHIAAKHAERFAAIISIIGDLDGSDVRPVQTAFAGKPVYLVMGGKDPIMGPKANAYTMRQLAMGCVPFSSYVAPEGGHSLYDAVAQVAQAWNDMFAGIVRGGSSNECSASPGGIP